MVKYNLIFRIKTSWYGVFSWINLWYKYIFPNKLIIQIHFWSLIRELWQLSSQSLSLASCSILSLRALKLKGRMPAMTKANRRNDTFNELSSGLDWCSPKHAGPTIVFAVWWGCVTIHLSLKLCDKYLVLQSGLFPGWNFSEDKINSFLKTKTKR